MRWRVSRSTIADRLEESFTSQPYKRYPLMAYELYEGVPLRRWPLIAILGRYLVRYKEWNKRDYGASLTEVYNELAFVLRREKAEWTCKGVDAVFTKQCSWINGNKLQFLTNREWFEKHVVPAVTASTSRGGEQSEWNDLDDEVTRKRVRL